MAANTSNHAHLIRGLGLIAAISVIIGNVIGTGVFLKARVMTCNLGSAEWVLIAWIAAGLLSLAGALTYAELTAMKPEAGGEYVFLRDAYGGLWSFLFGWMQIFIAKAGAQASVAVVFAIGLNDFFGGGLKKTLLQTNLFGSTFEITSLQLLAILMIVVFTAINCGSVSFSGQVASFLTFVKIALIVFVGFGAFLFVSGGNFGHFGMTEAGGVCEGVNASVRFGSANYSFLAGFGAAMLGALWGYDGWNNLTFVAGEVKDPKRNIPIAIIGSTILVIILYVFVHIGYFYLLDPTSIASVSKDSSVAKVIVSKFFAGDVATFATGICVALFTIGLMLSSLGTLHTSILAGSRVSYAMAKDRYFPKALSKLSVTHVPVRSLVAQGVWASILALSGSFDSLTDYVIFGSWIFYALVTSSIFVFRKKEPNAERPYKAFGYPIIPVVFLFVAVGLLIQTVATDFAPGLALIKEQQYFTGLNAIIFSPSVRGLFLIALGLPFYYYFNWRQNAEPTKSEPEN
jgi:APA family basic amino acid/polyamine antiporter